MSKIIVTFLFLIFAINSKGKEDFIAVDKIFQICIISSK